VTGRRPTRLVLDTSVIVAALRSRSGASARLLMEVAARRIVPVATPALFLEYEEVLKRPEQRKASGMTLADVDRVLRALALLIDPVDVPGGWRPQLHDADDELVLEAAVHGRADALVTHNVRHFVQAAQRFSIRVARPGQIVKEIDR